MLILDEHYVSEYLTAEVCVALMEEILQRERMSACTQYLRTAHVLPNTNVLGLMPAYDERGYFGVKVISVYHTNGGTAWPSHQGQILLFGAEHGEPLAMVDAMSVTKIRTGAVSAAATRALAQKGASCLALLGCGAQGESHLVAMAVALPLREVRCWDRTPPRAEALAAHARELGLAAWAFHTAEETVSGADVICTLTAAHDPILHAAWVKPGAHINAVGACAPDAREVDSDLAAGSRFFCDSCEAILHESGDFLIPQREGRYGKEHLIGCVGDVLLGRIPGRTTETEITMFDGVGMAAEDLTCAIWLYERASGLRR